MTLRQALQELERYAILYGQHHNDEAILVLGVSVIASRPGHFAPSVRVVGIGDKQHTEDALKALAVVADLEGVHIA